MNDRTQPDTPSLDPRGWQLPDGTAVRVRTLHAEDRPLEIAFIESLSQETRYFRLMTPLRYLSPELIGELMNVNDDDRTALIATVDDNGKEKIIGVARYARAPGTVDAELGITVADAWQHRGVASQLILRLGEYARQHGIERFVGQVLPDNHRMLALARKLGFRVRLDPRSHLMHIEKDLRAHSSAHGST
jgi:acetyltransferase